MSSWPGSTVLLALTSYFLVHDIASENELGLPECLLRPPPYTHDPDVSPSVIFEASWACVS